LGIGASVAGRDANGESAITLAELQIAGQIAGAQIQRVGGLGASIKCRGRRDRQNFGARSHAPAILIGQSKAVFSTSCLKFFLDPRMQLLPAMDSLTAIAASGLRARMESLELLANNVANASTGGYKADREFYSLYTAPEAWDSEVPSTMPVIERPWIDFSQGVLQATNNPLDVALSGNGFFSVNAPGGPLYTRNGNFRLSANGKLITADGYAVRSQGGGELKLDASQPVEILDDGTVRQNGATVGKLDIADFTTTAGLEKQGSNYLRVAGPASGPASPSGTTVQQGKLESSNTGAAEMAVRLVSVMRQFEMLQKAASLGADMNKQAIEQVAKVGA
jgi:flagellar basal-body rod protein FlgF